jgi:hypothetical protein
MVNNSFNLSASTVTVDLSGIPEGVYMLFLNDGKITHKLKIIRIK